MADPIPYGDYDKAYKAIHSALNTLMAPQTGHKITRLSATWNPNGTMNVLTFADGVTDLFTITFTWNLEGTWATITRTDLI